MLWVFQWIDQTFWYFTKASLKFTAGNNLFSCLKVACLLLVSIVHLYYIWIVLSNKQKLLFSLLMGSLWITFIDRKEIYIFVQLYVTLSAHRTVRLSVCLLHKTENLVFRHHQSWTAISIPFSMHFTYRVSSNVIRKK